MRPQQLLLVDSNNEEYEWKLVPNSEPGSESPAPEEYKDGIGLTGFNFPEAFSPPAASNRLATSENAANCNKENWREFIQFLKMSGGLLLVCCSLQGHTEREATSCGCWFTTL